MSDLKTAFQASLESHADEAENLSVGGVDSMESHLIDMQQSFEQAEAAQANVEDLTFIADQLDGVKASVESLAQEEGGLSHSAATMMHHAVAAHTARLGLEAEQVVPALESFGGETSAERATQYSMESIGDTVRKIWNAIKSAIQKAIKATSDFFAKVFGGVDKVLDRISDLEKKVGKLKAEGKGKMSVPNVGSLHYKGKADLGAINTGMKNLVEVSALMSGKYLEEAASAYDAMANTFKDDKTQKASGGDEATKLIEDMNQDLMKVTKVVATAESKEVSGGKVLEITGSSDDEDTKLSLPKLKDASSKAPSSEEIDLPSKGELSDLLKQCKAVADDVKGAKGSYDKLKDAREDAMTKAEDFVKAAEGNKLGKAWDKAKANMMLRKANFDAGRPIAQVTSHSFSTVRAALALVEKAVKEHEKGSDKKDDDK